MTEHIINQVRKGIDILIAGNKVLCSLISQLSFTIICSSSNSTTLHDNQMLRHCQKKSKEMELANNKKPSCLASIWFISLGHCYDAM